MYVPQGFVDRLHTQHTSILSDVYQTGFVRLIEMPEDYFCHSKYYYSFQELGSKKDIVLCDDDVVYHKNWLNGLWQAAQQYPDVQVIAYQALEITHRDGCIEPYDNWRFCRGQEVISSGLLYAEAVAGVLYRRNSMRRETLNKDVFLSIVPKADDVWLCFCSYYNRNKMIRIPTGTRLKTLFVIPDSQEIALWKENTMAKRNDRYTQAVYQYFREHLGMDILQQSRSLDE